MSHANLSIFVPHNGCPNRCVFCNQVNISGRAKEPTGHEVRELCRRHLGENKNRECEIAFFGGSFTAIRRDYMLELLDAAYEFVKRGEAKGIRLSTRPDAIDGEIIEILKSRGITAVELGAQSMCNGVLESNKRGHTAEQVSAAAQLIKAAGFELGLQMMVGMYGEQNPREAALYTARRIAELNPDTVRIYPTLVVEGTELSDLHQRGEYTPISLETAVDITSELLLFFEEKGIRVIRCGLHADRSLEQSLKGGPFHPAFRELCESRIIRRGIESLLVNKPQKMYTVLVAEKGESRAVGNRRSNLEYFVRMGYALKIRTDPTLSKYQVKLTEEDKQQCI